jgi:SAM-dependent methyltransferase
VTLERVDITNCVDPLQIVLHRNRYDFVLGRLRGNENLLEIGTGPGIFSLELLAQCRTYKGIEYDPATCEEARRNTQGKADIIVADARHLPFGDDEFSFIVCLEVLEHLGDFHAGVKEILRCLCPTGTAIISVPYRRHGGPSKTNEYHLYEPGERELLAVLEPLFNRVEVFYQCFEERWWWTIARCLHIRRFVGLRQLYADLAAGEPSATARLHIVPRRQGLTEGLIILVGDKCSQK